MDDMAQLEKYFGKDLEALFYADKYYEWIVSEIRHYLGKNFVEVGAGSGTFSEIVLRTNPRSLTAVEPSDNMFKLLGKRFEEEKRISMLKGTFQHVRNKIHPKPDTAFYINVLEHIKDDEKELSDMYNFLPKGGHICIFVPALMFLYGTFDKNICHYRRYTKKELIKKLEKAGFQIERAKYMDFLGILPWLILFRIFKKQTLNKKQVVIYDKFVVPIMRLFESIITPPIGKNVLVVGKKI